MANRRLLLLYQYCILGFAVLAAILLGESQRDEHGIHGRMVNAAAGPGLCLIFVLWVAARQVFSGSRKIPDCDWLFCLSAVHLADV